MSGQIRSSDSIATYTWVSDDYNYPNPGMKSSHILTGLLFLGLGQLFISLFGVFKLCLISVFLIFPGTLFLTGLALSIAAGDSSKSDSNDGRTILGTLFSSFAKLWKQASRRSLWVIGVLISVSFLVMGICWH